MRSVYNIIFCGLSALTLCLLSCRVYAQPIDTTGCYLRGSEPLSVCRMQAVTVDTAVERIRLIWRVNTGAGVAGYCICTGSPCLGLDTLWGARDTTYLCMSHGVDEVHSYSLFAIDSCLHGGEMTDAVSNMVLQAVSDSCSREVRCSWNAASLASTDIRYVLRSVVDGTLRCDTVGTALSHVVRLSPDAMHLCARVAAVGDGLEVWSNAVDVHFLPPDSCRGSSDPVPPPLTKMPADPFVPNCFSPMLSSNNCFAPVFPPASTPDDYTLRVYNRIGALVYQTRDVAACWDGSYRGSILPQGVYVYHIIYRYADDIRRQTGSVLLIR